MGINVGNLVIGGIDGIVVEFRVGSFGTFTIDVVGLVVIGFGVVGGLVARLLLDVPGTQLLMLLEELVSEAEQFSAPQYSPIPATTATRVIANAIDTQNDVLFLFVSIAVSAGVVLDVKFSGCGCGCCAENETDDDEGTNIPGSTISPSATRIDCTGTACARIV